MIKYKITPSYVSPNLVNESSENFLIPGALSLCFTDEKSAHDFLCKHYKGKDINGDYVLFEIVEV